MPHGQTSRRSSGRHSASKMRQPPPSCAWSRSGTSKVVGPWTSIDLSGYSDPLAIIIKFRRGLNASTQDRIAESGTDRPADDDPNGWYKAARRFDLNRLANEAFHASSTKRSAPSHQASDGRMSYLFARALAPTYPAKPAPSSFPPSRPAVALHPGVPMDIDAQRAKTDTPHTCHRCGSPNHLIRDCPRRFDVRHMCTEEIDEFLADVLARRDPVAAGSTSEGSEAGVTVVEREATEEYFDREFDLPTG